MPRVEPIRGIFLVRSTFGYDVEVDGRAFGLDVSWTAADKIARTVARFRADGDSRGYARCHHKGTACWEAGRCIKYPALANPKRYPNPRSRLMTTIEEYEVRKRLKDG